MSEGSKWRSPKFLTKIKYKIYSYFTKFTMLNIIKVDWFHVQIGHQMLWNEWGDLKNYQNQ